MFKMEAFSYKKKFRNLKEPLTSVLNIINDRKNLPTRSEEKNENFNSNEINTINNETNDILTNNHLPYKNIIRISDIQMNKEDKKAVVKVYNKNIRRKPGRKAKIIIPIMKSLNTSLMSNLFEIDKNKGDLLSDYELTPLKVNIKELDEFFICHICKGYLYSATTITECLHTFCKGCLVKHLTFNLNCPKCYTLIHPTDPLVNIRHDSTYQDILYKLVPHIEKDERDKETQFYKHQEELSTAHGKDNFIKSSVSRYKRSYPRFNPYSKNSGFQKNFVNKYLTNNSNNKLDENSFNNEDNTKTNNNNTKFVHNNKSKNNSISIDPNTNNKTKSSLFSFSLENNGIFTNVLQKNPSNNRGIIDGSSKNDIDNSKLTKNSNNNQLNGNLYEEMPDDLSFNHEINNKNECGEHSMSSNMSRNIQDSASTDVEISLSDSESYLSLDEELNDTNYRDADLNDDDDDNMNENLSEYFSKIDGEFVGSSVGIILHFLGKSNDIIQTIEPLVNPYIIVPYYTKINDIEELLLSKLHNDSFKICLFIDHFLLPANLCIGKIAQLFLFNADNLCSPLNLTYTVIAKNTEF